MVSVADAMLIVSLVVSDISVRLLKYLYSLCPESNNANLLLRLLTDVLERLFCFKYLTQLNLHDGGVY